MINSYTKARVYTADRVFIGNADVTGKYEDREVLLRIGEDVMERLYTSFIVTLYNDAYGLITYKAELVEFKKTLSKGNETVYDVKCELLQMLEILQRRGNVKVKVFIPATISLKDLTGEPALDRESGNPLQYAVTIRDVSASGILFSAQQEIPLGQRFDFLFSRTDPPFLITAEILRVQEYADGSKGYGCKFYGLSSAKETVIRQYVFKLQLLEQRNTDINETR